MTSACPGALRSGKQWNQHWRGTLEAESKLSDEVYIDTSQSILIPSCPVLDIQDRSNPIKSASHLLICLPFLTWKLCFTAATLASFWGCKANNSSYFKGTEGQHLPRQERTARGHRMQDGGSASRGTHLRTVRNRGHKCSPILCETTSIYLYSIICIYIYSAYWYVLYIYIYNILINIVHIPVSIVGAVWLLSKYIVWRYSVNQQHHHQLHVFFFFFGQGVCSPVPGFLWYVQGMHQS